MQGTDAAEIAVFADRATGRAIVICALDNLGKGAAGQAIQNANLALGLPETAGLRLAGVLGMSVTAAQGFVASGVECGIRRARRDLARRPLARPAVGAAMFTANRVQAAPVVLSKAHLARAEPQAVVINSGVANAATGERGELDAHRDGRRGGAAPRPARRAGARPLDRRDRRAAAAREAARRPAQRGRGALARRRRRRGGGDPDHRHAGQGGRRRGGAGSRSAGWRRAPG